MKKIQISALCVTLALIAGCASGPEVTTFVPTAEPGKAVIYHYRPWGFAGGAMNYYVAVNGQPLTVIKNGTVFKEVKKPGKLTYSAERNTPSGWMVLNPVGVTITNLKSDLTEVLSFNAENNEVYFVEWSQTGTKQTNSKEASEAIIGLSTNTKKGWE